MKMRITGRAGPVLAAPLLAVATLAIAAPSASAQEAGAIAEIVDRQGRVIGTAELFETPEVGVLVRAELEGLPPGTHAFHIHERGTCAPDFEAAGDHYAPRGSSHGMLHEGGPHVGDMLNIEVPSGGAVTVERLAPEASLRDGPTSLFDADGSALVVHEEVDDYRSQPSGDAGDRIACGVIERR